MSKKELTPAVRQFYEKAIPSIVDFGVTEESAKKEIAFAAAIYQSTPSLHDCAANSVFKSVIECASIGLSLNPALKLAYLIPRYSRSGKQCTLMPSYQGLVKLLTDSGSVSQVECNIVYDGDEFDLSLGTNPQVIHKPDVFSDNKSDDKIRGVYAVATLENGSKQIEAMSKKEIDYIRDSSDSYKAFKGGKVKQCVWADHYSEMARKTVIKRLVKYLPKTEKYENLARAVEQDNKDYLVRDVDPFGERILQLADKYCEEAEYKMIKCKLSEGVTKVEANEWFNELDGRKLNSVQTGQNYSQKEINEHLDDIMADERK